MLRIPALFITALALLSAPLASGQSAKNPPPVSTIPATIMPWDQNYIDLESGYLWKVGGDTPLNYGMVPTMLSWRSKEVLGVGFDDGSRLFVRNRLTLLGQWVETGPENHYFGVMGSPSIEWWNAGGTWSIYGGIGGGCGVIDSQGVPGGQGQDFTLNWFSTVGVAHAITETLQVRAGAMFQHLSNGGATNPNPGVNTLGFTLGLSWGF